MKKFPSISIILPTLYGGANLQNFLNGLDSQNYPKSRLEVIIVNNGNTKISSRSKNLKIYVIKNKANFGFAKAVNIGARLAKSDYFFITNDDVILRKDCLEKLVSFLEKKPEAGAVGPGYPMKYNFYLGLFKKNLGVKKTCETDWVPGSALLVPKKVWLELGGLDKEFFFTYEDLDFALRLKKLGYKSYVIPKAKIFHKDGATINKAEQLDLKYYQGYKGKFRLIFKHGDPIQKVTSLFLQFFVYLPYRRLIIKEKSTRHLLRAFFYNVKKINFKKN